MANKDKGAFVVFQCQIECFDIDKSIKALSGGEKGRMLFGKLMLQNPNVLVMDEPTNHLDMESIEALNLALENYEGTLISAMVLRIIANINIFTPLYFAFVSFKFANQCA
jgi:ABC-type Mn2+/Zn2+ transport system ATPase subunit